MWIVGVVRLTSSLRWWPEDADYDCMVTFVWLQCDLFLWFQFVSLQFLYLGGEHGLWLRGRIDTRRLYRNHKVAAIFQEILGVQRNDTGLIWLGDIGEYCVNHTDQHPVFVWMPSIFDNWNNVGAFFGHIDQVTARPMRKFNGIY